MGRIVVRNVEDAGRRVASRASPAHALEVRGAGSAAACGCVAGMSSTQPAATSAPTAPIRNASSKPRSAGRPLASTCADAVRNRARLVAAAARAFRDDGLGASVNAIAADAGVNVATLYRNFPTKDDLIAAVLEALLEPLAAARDRALAAPSGALAAFLRAAVELQAEQRGLIDALTLDPSGAEARRQLREPALELVRPIAERAHREGDLREDFGALDLLIALRMLTVIAGTSARLPEGTDRYVELVLRGLAPEPAAQ